MKLFIFISGLTAVQAGTACDLRGTDILRQLPNGKYNWSADYQLKYLIKNKLTGERLQNKGKLAKSAGLFKHINDGAYSDAWVVCKRNKFSMYLFKCFSDGTFEINGKTGDEISMPNCDPIGCDPADLGPFGEQEYTKVDGCKKGYIEFNGAQLENDKNICFRKCGETRSKAKIKCTCDYVGRSCEYQIKKGDWIPWDSNNGGGKPYVPTTDCPAVGTTAPPPPTEPPTTPSDWDEWSHWSACSAQCGTGKRRKDRTCSFNNGGNACDGNDSESEECTGPDGACPKGCKIDIGDFQFAPIRDKSATNNWWSHQMPLKDILETNCLTSIFRGADGYYLPPKVRCHLSCDGPKTGTTDTRYEHHLKWGAWKCQCKGPDCQLNFDNQALGDTPYGTDTEFNSVNDCIRPFGPRSHRESEKMWRWASGRRSRGQPADEVSGGSDWELMDICYDPLLMTDQDLPEFTTGSYTVGETDQTISADLIKRSATLYGKVTETSDGRLVCRYYNKQISFDIEKYLQLSAKKNTMSWVSSERYFFYGWHYNIIGKGEFGNREAVKHAQATGYDENNSGMVDTVCRVQDNRDGNWYVGSVVKISDRYVLHVPGRDYHFKPRNYVLHCLAFAPDGTELYTESHNYHARKEVDNDWWSKSEYFRIGVDDGSKWEHWSEWSACSATCGRFKDHVKKIRTRNCIDPSGTAIEPADGFNCIGIIHPKTSYYGTAKFEDGKSDSEQCEDDDVMDECPRWAMSWTTWSSCSKTCELGTKTRTKACICPYHFGVSITPEGAASYGVRYDKTCKETFHTLVFDGMCDGESEQVEAVNCKQSEVCN